MAKQRRTASLVAGDRVTVTLAVARATRLRSDVVASHALDDELVRLYGARGLLRDGSNPVHLPTECPRAMKCWGTESAERRPAPGSPAAALSPPHIGPRYDEERLVVVLENLRGYGGWDLGPQPTTGMRFLAAAGRVGLSRGATVLFRGGTYRGTMVWHRAAVYAAAWLDCDREHRSSDSPPAMPSPTVIAEALDFIALVQHVKCSPVGGRSDQNETMWRECGPHVLVHELAILKPSRMIVLGQGDNAHAVRTHILPELRAVVAHEVVQLGRRKVRLEFESRSGPIGNVDVMFMPHPATPGGTARRIITQAQMLLQATRVVRRSA
jgi:hypothetical protein